MIENAELDRLRSEREAEQELKKDVEFRAKLMQQIDAQKFPFDA